MRINPIYQKELKINVRTMRIAFILLGYNGLLALFGLFAFYVTFHYDVRLNGIIQYADILRIYAIIAGAEFGFLLFILPVLTSAAIAGEREKQTLEILLTTKTTPMQIIVGKLMSSISLMILLAFSSIPILALVFSIGGITFLDLLEFMVLIVITAIYIGSIGMFFSVLLKKTTLATVSTYATVLFLVVGTVVILWGLRVIGEMNMPIGENMYDNYADLGNLLLLLLINPAITCFAMIESQIGTGSNFNDFMKDYGMISTNMSNSWFLISIIVQVTISIILTWVSAKLLNPLRDKRGKIKK